MSNLIKPQLYPCQSAPALRSFSPLALLWFNHLLSCPLPQSPPLALTPYSLFFLHLYLFLLLSVVVSGSTLTRPSARAQTNQSRVVLFHKDQKQLVSSHVWLLFFVYLSRHHLSAWSRRNLLWSMNACLTFHFSLAMNYRLSAWLCNLSSCCRFVTHLVSSMVAIKETHLTFIFRIIFTVWRIKLLHILFCFHLELSLRKRVVLYCGWWDKTHWIFHVVGTTDGNL